MSQKRRILFYISTLKNGGAERVLTLMANYWADKGYDITIAVIIKEEIGFVLHPQIQVVQHEYYKVTTHFVSGLLANIKRIAWLRNVIKTSQPDVIISFTTMCNIVASFAKMGLKIPLIITERTNPSFFNLGLVWQQLKFIAYNRADSLVLQTFGVQKQYLDYKVPQDIIRNPLNMPPSASMVCNYDAQIIVTVGRLDTNKNVQMLVDAFAKTKNKDWFLWVIGRDAGSMGAIKTKAKNLGIDRQVIFWDNQTDVFRFLSQGSIFAMTSKVEGYPNSLLEAMAIGLPVISTNCDYGPAEIIEHGKNGFTVSVDDTEGFAQKLSLLMSDKDMRMNMGINARRVCDTHNLTAIMYEWEIIINRCISRY